MVGPCWLWLGRRVHVRWATPSIDQSARTASCGRLITLTTQGKNEVQSASSPYAASSLPVPPRRQRQPDRQERERPTSSRLLQRKCTRGLRIECRGRKEGLLNLFILDDSVGWWGSIAPGSSRIFRSYPSKTRRSSRTHLAACWDGMGKVALGVVWTEEGKRCRACSRSARACLIAEGDRPD